MRHVLIMGLLLVVALTGCGGSVGQSAQRSTGVTAGGAAVPESAEAPAAVGSDGGADSSVGNVPPLEVGQRNGAPGGQGGADRLVIRNAEVRLLVDAVDAAEQRVRAIAGERQGFVLSSQAQGDGNNRTATISFKVPSQRFDDAINAISGVARKVESLAVTGQDVTDEYVDLQSRLRTLQAVETRLLDFLAQAKTTKDALEINAQLTENQTQIEQLQGRIKFLEQSSAFSTITVSLHAETVVPVVPEAGWSAVRTARAALNGLVAFGQGLADVAIIAMVWSPVWLPLLLIALWIWRRVRRHAAPAPVAQTPTQP